jgi:hypothetical protein
MWGRGVAARAGRLRRVFRPPGSLVGTTCATPPTWRIATPRSRIPDPRLCSLTGPRSPIGRGPALRAPVVRVRLAPRARPGSPTGRRPAAQIGDSARSNRAPGTASSSADVFGAIAQMEERRSCKADGGVRVPVAPLTACELRKRESRCGGTRTASARCLVTWRNRLARLPMPAATRP